MESVWTTIAASAVLAMADLTAPHPAEAQTKPLSLTVAIYDNAEVDAGVLERAKTVARRIYRHIDVEMNWWGPDDFAADMQAVLPASQVPFGPLVRVRLMRSAPADGPMAGRGILGGAVQGSQLVSLLVERVNSLASRNGLDKGDLLGHVMAHEIGHLLLPPNSHSTTGLMARDMNLFFLARRGLLFDERQGVMIRARIAALSAPR